MLGKDLRSHRADGLWSLTPEKEDAIVAAVGRGVPLRTAVRTVGIGERTLRTWLRVATKHTTCWEDGSPITPTSLADVQRFTDRVELAMAECEARLAEAITNAVGVVGKSGVPEWRPALDFLKHSPTTRERWHEYRQVEVIQAEPFHELEQARSLSDEELLEQHARLSLPPGD